MFTLSDATRDTKLTMKWGGIIILTLIVLFLLFKVTLFIKELIFPTPPPKPTIAFGALTPQVFPQNITEQKFTYSIDTLTGDLPKLSDQIKVYKMVQPTPDLLALNKSQQIIGGAGFSGKAIPVSDRIFEWKNDSNRPGIERRVRMNILTHTFEINSEYRTDPRILLNKDIPNQEKSINLTNNTLSSMGLLPQDLDWGKTKTTLFAIRNKLLVEATSLSNANVVQVDLFQKDISKLPIYYENPLSSNMNFIVSGGNSEGQIVGARFNYQKVSLDSSTYPTKTAEDAYKELGDGKAYIGAYFGESTNIPIKNVFLAYYIGNQPQDFLMPIIVFEGNDGFFAYVPAITDEWIEK